MEGVANIFLATFLDLIGDMCSLVALSSCFSVPTSLSSSVSFLLSYLFVRLLAKPFDFDAEFLPFLIALFFDEVV